MSNTKPSRTRVAGFLIVGLSLSACEDSASSTEPLAVSHDHHAAAAAASPIGGAGKSVLKKVHAVAARFNSTKQAERAGYAEDTFCVESPAGGMGHHWVKGSLVDPVFDALNPEVVLYAPDKNGKMKLVAVEYIVVNTGQTAPTFDGQAFDVGGAPPLGSTPHWTLHVWLGETNPSGLFAPFNPNVDCP
jgi:hypothetical protein